MGRSQFLFVVTFFSSVCISYRWYFVFCLFLFVVACVVCRGTRPYRLMGCGGNGLVMAGSILSTWKEAPVTIIAAANATLLLTAVEMLGMTVTTEGEGEGEGTPDTFVSDDVSKTSDTDDDCDQDASIECKGEEKANIEKQDSSEGTEETTIDGQRFTGRTHIKSERQGTNDTHADANPSVVLSTTAGTNNPHLENILPKIHVNGKGENSGRKKWKSVLKQITFLYDLYKSEGGCILPKDRFPEFQGKHITWNAYVGQVESLELSRFYAPTSVVQKFRDQTLEAMELFERQVMNNNFEAEEANVILTTCHAAKGMEWDNVQVCEDFLESFKVNQEGPPVHYIQAGRKTSRNSWQFSMKNYGDDINLLYVACTRAKRKLAIPASIKTLIQECDMLHDLIQRKKLYEETDKTKNSEISVLGISTKKPLSVGNVLNLYDDLVLPLRKQFNLQTKDKILPTLIDDFHEADTTEDKSLEGDNAFEEYLSSQKKKVIKSEEPVLKKPKLAKIFYVLEDAEKAAVLAPKHIHRPYDKKDTAPTGKARCRECGECIAQGSGRVAVQVYQPQSSTFWIYAFHDKCCPKEALKRLKLDPNPFKKTSKKSWGGRGRNGYKKVSSQNGGWRKRYPWDR